MISNFPTKAFTTRLPFAVAIVFGIKQWENRFHMPDPTKGTCAISCSRNSTQKEYEFFLTWLRSQFGGLISDEQWSRYPCWEDVQSWRGMLVATCNYEASKNHGCKMWDEGLPCWWKLSNVKLLGRPLQVRGSLGMWDLPRCDFLI